MNHHPLMPVCRGLLALLLFVSANAFAADGVIQSASGDIFVNGNPASQGDEVSSGDTLKTAFGAWMVVEMEDQSVLDVRSNTEVVVSEYIYNPATPAQNKQDVSLVDGTLRYTSGLIAQNDYDDVAVRAGDFTIGVRGTQFTAQFNRNTGQLTVNVSQGSVGLGVGGSPATTVGEGGSADVNLSEGDTVEITVQNADGSTESAEYTVTRNADGSLDLSSTSTTTTTPEGTSTTTSDAPSFNQAVTNEDDEDSEIPDFTGGPISDDEPPNTDE